jgi:zinc transport system permease protein
MILISFLSSTKKIDLNNYFFGDLLKVTVFDLILITIGSIIILSILIYHWNDILTTTINEELAKIDGINLLYIRLIIMFMISLSISIAIKFVGSLLVTSLLVIPPSTAQHFSKSPEKMAFFTILISIISITGGICLSVYYSIPSSPAIVIFSTSIYFLSHLKKYFF